MISKNFKRIAFGTALALTTAFSAPAMAGLSEKYQDVTREQAMAACPKSELAKVPQNMVAPGVLELDFTKNSDTPEVCVAAFVKSQSSRYQVILAERQEEPWRTETLAAAVEIKAQTGQPVFVAYYKDVDPDDQRATTSFWAWGHKRDSYRLEDTYGIDEDMVAFHDSKNDMVSRGLGVQGFKDKLEQSLREKKEQLKLSAREDAVPVLAAK